MKFLILGLVSFHSRISVAKKASHKSKENCESHLGSGGTFKKTLYEIFRGQISKQLVGNSSGL
jgi:hypothetical protein